LKQAERNKVFTSEYSIGDLLVTLSPRRQRRQDIHRRAFTSTSKYYSNFSPPTKNTIH